MKGLKIILLLALLMIPVQSNARLIEYGLMRCTAYCPCKKCSGKWGVETYSGKTAEAGRTIAVDRSVIDIGSKVKVGDHIYTAEDIGGKVVGDTIDIFFDTHEEVEEWGVKYIECWVVK